MTSAIFPPCHTRKGRLNGMTQRTPSRASERLQEMYLELRDRICLLAYPPGARLKETVLASEFGVSRSPVRQVLSRLQGDGLIEIRHGAGTFVTDIDFPELLKVYDLRVPLSGMVGELDPNPPSARDIANWRGLIETIDEFAKRPDQIGYAELINSLHNLVLERIGNGALRDVIDRLFHLTARVWVYNRTRIDWPTEIAALTSEVEQIIRALEIGDLPGFGLAYRHSIEASVERIRTYMEGAADRVDGDATSVAPSAVGVRADGARPT